ncbi:signal recognition particle protein [Aquamicrobium defluvii]|uniref:Signal recognition particle protein n=1 Tax=Aquamicrobium defluvii TaxID=69279 RepID=A0A011UW72_9HYPH|nr:signal recognition particle protein [Aquamicrobium defluvii]EXL10451.1 signal recognition particle [Aquamicrobium defluvii]EZQ17628.1 signal recognition particle [Halopseudomonas bauzanensis]TDR37250.1 signal recognition particle subunit FFH/SRP54 (srp54) [Aquamicrobium defluvii]
MFESLQERLGSILNGLTGRGALSEADVSAALREVRRALLEADVALDVVRSFTDRVREQAVGAAVLKSIKPGQMVVKIVHDELVAMLGEEGVPIDLNAPAPVVVMMVGLQGSGKTTTTAKIARRLTERQGKKVLMASLDTRRPAAQEQLRQLGEQTKVATLPIVAGQSPVDIARRAVQAAKLGGHDVVILDTAGRTHIDEPLMAEMAEIRTASNPHEILLVADSLTGQDAVNLARNFDERVGITGLVLTRMDGDGRGGAALSMRAVTGKPIKLIGTGEKMDALEEFYPKRIADRILGMGDIVSLVEKAAETIDAEKAAAMAKKMQSGKFDLNDLADQLGQMQKMGGMGGIMGMMPGMGKMKDQMAAAGLDDKMFRRQLAIISSMTKAERANPDILKHSRKKRIAAGSGTDAAEINKLLKMHRGMADMMKAMGGKGKGGGMMRGLMGGLASKMGMGGLGGMMGGMPDLSKMDPKQIEALKKQAEAAGLGKGLPGGLPGGMPGGLPGGLPGLGGGLPGLPGGMKLPGLGGLPGNKKK